MINQSLLLAGDDGYKLSKSLRFRASASAYLSKTYSASPTVRTTQTLSFWLKRGALSSEQVLVAGYDGSSPGGTRIMLQSGNALEFHFAASTSLVTSQVFRDSSAWYHVVLTLDTTQATSSNRVKIYINGTQVTAFATANYPSQNATSQFLLNNSNNRIGCQDNNASFTDGYLTEVNFIDGQALTPSSFGSTNPLTGVWQPKKYAGTYGTNGFYLPFTDVATTSGSNAGLGKDFSGNGNYWNTNNISVTAGATYDSMTDVPTLTSSTASNFAVLNPLNRAYSTYTLSDGNLNWTSGTVNQGAFGTIQLPTIGKYYWEVVMTANAGGNPLLGIGGGNIEIGTIGAYYRTNGLKEQYGAVSGNGSSSYGATWTTNDVIGVAYDADTSGGQITFYKNNSSQGVAFTGLTANFPNGLFAGFQNNATGTTTFQTNFGQRPFTHTPPTGFKALNTFNLPEPSIKAGNKHFDATLYMGNGTGQTITNTGGFQPDLIWFKSRSNAFANVLFDSIRGVTKGLSSNLTDAEYAGTVGKDLTVFNSNGFTLGAFQDWGSVNGSASSDVAWQWKANGSAVTNTAGSITSQVSANASAGFSVVTYTGNGTAGATIGHGLGVAPKMVIVKSRGIVSPNYGWQVQHASLGATKFIVLNSTGASVTSSGMWNDTAPTSSVFSLGNDWDVNKSATTYVAYCFSEVAGYSKFGSYTGNGSSDGTFVHLGFRPKFIMVKCTNDISHWTIVDRASNPYNVAVNSLYADTSASENATIMDVDFLSNGFKLRGVLANECNVSGYNYVYMAFAEVPQKFALGT